MRYAIEKTLEDPNTGVESSFHLLTGYTVSYPNYVSATVHTYASKKAFEANKQAVSQNTIQVLGLTLPFESNPEKVIADALLVAEPAQDSWIQNADLLAGGKLVEIETKTEQQQ